MMAAGPEAGAGGEEGELVLARASKVVCFVHGPPGAHIRQAAAVTGTVSVSNFRVAFETESSGLGDQRLDLPLSCLHSLFAVGALPGSWTGGTRRRQRLSEKLDPASYEYVELVSKDFSRHWLGVELVPRDELKKLVSTLLHYAFPTTRHRLFAFDFKRALPGASKSSADDAALGSEYVQQARKTVIAEMARCNANKDCWSISEANSSFKLCPSYPPLLVVPVAVTDQDLQRSSKYWAGRRFPVLSWGNPSGKVWLARAGAPSNVAVLNDETTPDPVVRALYRKCRKFAHVEANVIGSFADVDAAAQKIRDAGALVVDPDTTNAADSHWLGMLGDSSWMEMVSACLRAAKEAVHKMFSERQNVLLTGDGDGDSDCIVASLVQIMVDPAARTRSGFQSLVCREWLSMGHPFCTRCGHVTQHRHGKSPRHPQDGEAPVFFLFLDCVHQLMVQNPLNFEITPLYLLRLWRLVTSCQYGTFLANCDKDRLDHGRLLQTQSAWSHWDGLSEKEWITQGLVEPLFRPRDKHLDPTVEVGTLRFWQEGMAPFLGKKQQAAAFHFKMQVFDRLTALLAKYVEHGLQIDATLLGSDSLPDKVLSLVGMEPPQAEIESVPERTASFVNGGRVARGSVDVVLELDSDDDLPVSEI